MDLMLGFDERFGLGNNGRVAEYAGGASSGMAAASLVDVVPVSLLEAFLDVPDWLPDTAAVEIPGGWRASFSRTLFSIDFPMVSAKN